MLLGYSPDVFPAAKPFHLVLQGLSGCSCICAWHQVTEHTGPFPCPVRGSRATRLLGDHAQVSGGDHAPTARAQGSGEASGTKGHVFLCLVQRPLPFF